MPMATAKAASPAIRGERIEAPPCERKARWGIADYGSALQKSGDANTNRAKCLEGTNRRWSLCALATPYHFACSAWAAGAGLPASKWPASTEVGDAMSILLSGAARPGRVVGLGIVV